MLKGRSFCARILVIASSNLSTMAVERPTRILMIPETAAKSLERLGASGMLIGTRFPRKLLERSGSAKFPANILEISGAGSLFSNSLEILSGAILFPNELGMSKTCKGFMCPSRTPIMFIVEIGVVDFVGSFGIGSGRCNDWKRELSEGLGESESGSYLAVVLKTAPNADLSEEGFLFRMTEASLCPSNSELFKAPLSCPFIVEDERTEGCSEEYIQD